MQVLINNFSCAKEGDKIVIKRWRIAEREMRSLQGLTLLDSVGPMSGRCPGESDSRLPGAHRSRRETRWWWQRRCLGNEAPRLALDLPPPRVYPWYVPNGLPPPPRRN